MNTAQARPGPDPNRHGSRRRRGTGHELRETILHVATQLLAELGDVAAMTMRAVANAADVTAPSVYRHFPDKQTLVRTVITERFDEFTAILRASTDGVSSRGGGPVEQLTAMAHAYVNTGLAEPGTYRVLFSTVNAGNAGLGLADDAEHPGATAFQTLLDAVAACIPGPPHTDPPNPHVVPELAIELWASLHGLVDLRITKPEVPWPDPEPLIDRALQPIRDIATRSTHRTQHA